MGKISDTYDDIKRRYPEAKLAIDVLPYTGVVTSAADTLQALSKGDYEDAAENAVGLIPGLKTGVVLSKARKAKAMKEAKNAVRGTAKVTDAALDAGAYQKATDTYAKGGRVTGYRGYGRAKKV